jgi:hypothetical protein
MYRVVCLVYKSLNNLTPDYLSNMFKPLSTVSQRHTRSTANMDLWVPNHKLKCCISADKKDDDSIFMLPPDIRYSSSFQAFKRKAMNFFWICIKITRKMYSVR